MKWLVLGTLCALWARWPAGRERRTVAGPVRGALSPDGRYEQFLAVPYGYTDEEHRFQEPLPVPKWDGVYDAIEENVRCPQRFTSSLILGRENCLTLNIYVPTNIAKPLPVMVFFHGGGFREGSGSPFIYGPDYIVDKEVILVTVNYRVEILGFLCLGIKEAPGNAGLKDQIAALRWIKENIKYFSGDPDNITIFGESAGASSVFYHIISSMSKGLFNKAIMQSGTAITPWAFQYDPVKIASMLAKQMGYKTDDPYELYNIFKNKTVEELLRTRIPRADGNIVLSETLFVPCVEKHIPGVQSFITDYPYNLLAEGKINNVPMLLGYNNAEGYMFVGKENETTIAKIDISKSLPRDLQFPNNTIEITIADKVRKIYLGSEKISKDNLVKLSRFYGEPFFKYPVIVTTDLILKYNKYPIYNYRFSYDGWLNIAKAFFGYAQQPGATHADDLFYIFKTKFPVPWILETKMINRITTMWTNFAKFGNPTPAVTPLLPVKWLPTDRNEPRILVIDKEFSTAPLWDEDSIKFWHDTYSKYRRKY